MTPDIVANAIVAALSAGAVAGATDTAKSAIADAYQGLKSLIKKKSGDESEAAKAKSMLLAGYRLSGFGEERCAHLWLQPGQRG
jgi:hypothetical protein